MSGKLSTLSLSTLYEEVLLTKITIYVSEKLSLLGNRFVYTMDKINFGYSIKNIGFSYVISIRFRKTRNHFQKEIQKDIQLIKSSDKTVTFTDKTTNLYRLTKAEYDHVINNAITSKYKKVSNNV